MKVSITISDYNTTYCITTLSIEFPMPEKIHKLMLCARICIAQATQTIAQYLKLLYKWGLTEFLNILLSILQSSNTSIKGSVTYSILQEKSAPEPEAI